MALEWATERFGAGDLAARAPESGNDEIGRVAAAFNRMASELAMREEALRTSDRLRRQMLADVVTGELVKLPGVSRTQTMVAFEVFSRHDLEAMFSIGG